mmetsp:Transcript_46739/g.107301  ORF Transcript_46739/g.107301 Transcript_46739/m.107301 type:complete len:301 (-) Transcript_46739:12-914(-)
MLPTDRHPSRAARRREQGADPTNSTDRRRKHAKRPRWHPNLAQEALLQNIFTIEPHPCHMVKRRLGLKMDVNAHSVDTWFRNRRKYTGVLDEDFSLSQLHVCDEQCASVLAVLPAIEQIIQVPAEPYASHAAMGLPRAQAMEYSPWAAWASYPDVSPPPPPTYGGTSFAFPSPVLMPPRPSEYAYGAVDEEDAMEELRGRVRALAEQEADEIDDWQGPEAEEALCLLQSRVQELASYATEGVEDQLLSVTKRASFEKLKSRVREEAAATVRRRQPVVQLSSYSRSDSEESRVRYRGANDT